MVGVELLNCNEIINSMDDEMKAICKAILLVLAALVFTGCASDPVANDPYNDADSQRSRADKAQDELSNETR
jgi:PBP1b-binding outer membrane lipoprotein LpoB